MATVLLDSEEVTFNGPAPKDVKEVIFFINKHLWTQGKYVSSVSMDGYCLDVADYERLAGSFEELVLSSEELPKQLLARNRDILLKRFPYVLKGVIESEPEVVLKGVDVAVVRSWVSAQVFTSSGCYVLMGFEPVLVRELLKCMPEHAVLFVAEANVFYLRMLFSSEDYGDLLSDPRFYLIAGEVGYEGLEVLQGCHLALVDDIEVLEYGLLKGMNEVYYEAFLGEFANYFRYARDLQLTAIHDSEMWQNATFRNLKKLVVQPDVGVTRDIFRDLPVVLVSAGPSLDLSLEFLRYARDRAVVVCVNSAYSTLMKHGIRPHVTIAADPRDATFRGYEGWDTEDVYLFGSYIVNPRVVEAFEGRTFSWASANSLISWVYEQLKLPLPTAIPEIATVAASLPPLAELWGVSRVCLVGQDLAIMESGQTHSRDSFYEQRYVEPLDKSEYKSLPGNTLGEVYLNDLMMTNYNAMNEVVGRYGGIEFINTSKLGAQLEGARYVDFDEALEWLGDGDASGVTERLGMVYESGVREGLDVEGLSELLISFSGLLMEKVLEGALYTEFLPEKLGQKNYCEHSGIIRAYQYSDEVNRLIDRFPNEYRILVDGRTKKALYDYMEFCRKDFGFCPHWKQVQENGQFFWALAEGAYHFGESRVVS